MTERQEFYAATVQEAVDKAAAAMGVDPAGLEFEVLDEGSGGFLGIGARDARIAVEAARDSTQSVLPEPVEAPAYAEAVGPQSPEELEEMEGPVEDASEETEEATEPGQAVPEELLLAADDFMTGLIDSMGFDGTVDAYEAEESVVVEVTTPQTGLFIGQKGETIDAVQRLLNLAVYKDRPFVKRIMVDTEGYRQRRIEAIQGMAHRTARRVQRERRPLSLPPMPSSERRVVHLYLKENPDVSTASEGQDEDRRVVVSPT